MAKCMKQSELRISVTLLTNAFNSAIPTVGLRLSGKETRNLK